MVIHRRVVQVEPLKIVKSGADRVSWHGRLESLTKLFQLQLVLPQQNALFVRVEEK